MVDQKRLDSLTGMRFAAALIVVFFHSVSNLQTGHALVSIPSMPILVGIGYVGVNFFFVLSGFVLAWADKQENSALYFYQKRIARIYPVHIFTLILSGLGQIAFGLKTGLLGLLCSALLLQAWFSDPRIHFAMNGVSWSLSVEAFFYLLFPTVIKPIKNLSTTRLQYLIMSMVTIEVIIGFASLYFSNNLDSEAIWISPLFCLPQFIVGLALGCSTNLILKFRLPVIFTYLVIVGTYISCSVADTYLHSRFNIALPRTFTAAIMLVPIIILITSAASEDMLGGSMFWSKKPMVVLGEWSFALYMAHPLVLALLTRIFKKSTSYELYTSIFLEIFFVLLSVAAAGFTHHYVERPFEKIIRPKKLLQSQELV